MVKGMISKYNLCELFHRMLATERQENHEIQTDHVDRHGQR